MSLLPGFTKGQSDNLPKIDSMSMFSVLAKNAAFMGPEIQAKRSKHESYGDNAVGYVQVKRDSNLCTVKAKITPECTLPQKAYDVTLLYNDVDEEVISVSCDDCAASLGGCKHPITLLTWLHRRSEEPAVTPVSCYWKKSEISTVGETPKFIKAKDLGTCYVAHLRPSDGSFLKAVVEHAKREGFYDTPLLKYFKEPTDVELISIHRLSLNFFRGQQGGTADDFLNYCSSHMPEAVCNDAANETVLRHESALWDELRYGRITAAKAYEAAHCETLDESLVDDILGPISLKDSAAMKKQRKLKAAVRKQIEKEKNIQIKLCGFLTSAKCPVMGASPDGISNDYVIEIKCLTPEKAITYYVKNGKPEEKYRAKIQVQMFFCKKKQGLFCIADMDFEKSKKLSIITVEYDEQYCLDILEKSKTFWKKSVFPVLKESSS